MKREKIIRIIFPISFILALPSIINLFTGNFIPSKVFKKVSIQNIIKTVILSKYPEWKPIENDLDSLIPNSSSNVSVESVYGETRKTLEIHITTVTDQALTVDQINNEKVVICDNLIKSTNKYDIVELSAYNFKSYSFKERFKCP